MQTTFDYRGIGEVLKSSQFRLSLEADVTQLTLCPIHGFVSKFELFETETIFVKLTYYITSKSNMCS